MDFRSSSEYSDSDSNATVHSNWEKDFQRRGEKGNHKLDNLINTNLRAESNKVSVNDIRSHKSKSWSNKRQPTSVTYLNVRGGEQGRQSKIEGLDIVIDSGCSKSLIQYEWVSNAAGGDFSTTKEVKVKFLLPQFIDSKFVTHKFQIDESDETGIGYDAAIGRDLLSTMGAALNFKDEVIKWDQMITPMKDYYSKSPSNKATHEELRVLMTPSELPIATQETLKGANKILDAGYEKADIKDVVNQESLSQEEGKELYELLEENEELFNGTLEDWKTKPVNLN